MKQPSGQLGFGDLLPDTRQDHQRRKHEQETAHLPGTMDEAVPVYLGFLTEYDRAILGGRLQHSVLTAAEAKRLAVKLNGGTSFAMCCDDGAATQLMVRTATPDGQVPLWGQRGAFIVDVAAVLVKVSMHGLFDIGAGGFDARAVDRSKPFISDTGYRSFMGSQGDPGGLTTGGYAEAVLRGHVAKELKGRLVRIEERGGRSR